MPPELILWVSIVLLTLCLGLIVGGRLERRLQTSLHSQQFHAGKLSEMMGGFAAWTRSFSNELTAHRHELGLLVEQAAERRDAPQSPAPPRVALLGEISAANIRLQERLAAAEQRLQQQAGELEEYLSEARTDGLTGLPNRRAWDEEVGRRQAEWRRYGTAFSVLLIDADHFKQVNDVHGHPAGDAVLCELGRRLRRTVRQADFVARFGGEEFAVLLVNTVGPSAAMAAENVRRAIAARPINVGARPLDITASVGAASTRPGEELPELIARADAALYAAKSAGRDRVYWHDGATPQPAESGVVAASAAPQPAPCAPAAVEVADSYRDTCQQLRQRLRELVDNA